VLCSLIRVAVGWVATKNYFLSKALACILSRSKSRTHRLDGDNYVRAARYVTICPVSEMSEKSDMTARHVMHSLGEPAV
jgi:hypothetical protein